MNSPDVYDPIIKAAVARVWPEIDWRLIKAQVKAESAFNARAVSRCGACGLMQLMSETAAEVGVKDVFNPVQNIAGGVKYLKMMFDRFKDETGDERFKFALGAYNAGAGSIIKAQGFAAGKGIAPDKWESIVKMLPVITGTHAAETIGYVEKIFKFWNEYKGGE